MKDGDPATFWPLGWLSKDRDFRDVRIHIFGYDPSDMGVGRMFDVNILEYAQSLLQWFTNCPDTGNKDEVL